MPLSLNDIRHLDAAETWLERGDYLNCFEELERIAYSNRGHARELVLRWKLYHQSGYHVSAANLAEGIQHQFPDEPAGYVWRAVSLSKLGCAQEAYDGLLAVADRFDGLGMIYYTLAVLAARLERTILAGAWLVKAYHTPQGREMKPLSLKEEEQDEFWRKIEAV